jgi:hypothetical protein
MRKRVVICIAVTADTAESVVSGCEEGAQIAIEAIKDRTQNGTVYSTGSTNTVNNDNNVSVDITFKEM